jgi:hypothetical protein
VWWVVRLVVILVIVVHVSKRTYAVNVVLVASRSVGPDKYTHISGPTGRAGKSGNVFYVISDADVQKVTV